MRTQECYCGNDSYHLNLIFGKGSGVIFVASCTECGRITRAVGDGPKYHGKDVNKVDK